MNIATPGLLPNGTDLDIVADSFVDAYWTSKGWRISHWQRSPIPHKKPLLHKGRKPR